MSEETLLKRLEGLDKIASLLKWVFGSFCTLVAAVFALGCLYNNTQNRLTELENYVSDAKLRRITNEARWRATNNNVIRLCQKEGIQYEAAP